MLSVDCNFDDLQNKLCEICNANNDSYIRVFFKDYDKLIIRCDLNFINDVSYKRTFFYRDYLGFKVIIEINSQDNKFVFNGTIPAVEYAVKKFVDEHKVEKCY